MSVCLDQRQIPGLTRLFADYLYDFPRVARFYGDDASPFAAGALAAASRVDYPADRRARVAAILAGQNRAWGAGAATEANIEAFRKPETVAVVGGQQVGLLGGPLLTVYKAMTAVLAAGQLCAEGHPAVPVFWLATQDHDLAEINHTWVPRADGQPIRIELATPQAPPSHAAAQSSVGRIALGPEITAFLDAFARASAAPPEAMASFAAAYHPAATFGSAFAQLLTRWFAPWGLILLDPLDPRFAAEAAPLLAAVLDRHPALAVALRQRGGELEAAGYHRQVHDAGAALLFLETAGQRQPLRPGGNGYQAGGQPWSAAALHAALSAQPERFSPGALLRPVVQDWLLPTAAQVTGPAETAYLAQSAALYQALDRPQPLRLPRFGATLLDARARRLLGKYQLTVPDIWRLDPQGDVADALALRLAQQNLPGDLAAQLRAQREATSSGFAALSARLAAVDPTLVDFLRTAGEKVGHQFDQVEAKVSRSLARRQEDLSRQARHLTGVIFPHRHLQERVWNSAAAALRLGAAWPGLLHDALRLGCPGHQLLDV